MAANTAGICTSFKQDLLNGIHVFGPSNPARSANTADAFYAALFFINGGLSVATTSYSTTGEVDNPHSGATIATGYTAGGVAVTNATPPANASSTAYWTPSASIAWTGLTIAGTAFDTVMIYNSSASGKNAVALFNFSAQTITAGNLSLTMPTNSYSAALIRLA